MAKTILVIDDERATLKMFQLLLKAYGYTMLGAASGAEGVEIFLRERPSLVITDIKMPGMDGMEVLRRIKAIDRQAEVIVVTGHGDIDMALLALNLDATDFIDKPVQRVALSQALHRAEERLALAKSKAGATGVESSPGAALLRLRGSINASSEPFLLHALERAYALGKPRLVLRFEAGTTANGAGLALLIQLLLAARQRGLGTGAEGVPEELCKAFEIVGITTLLDDMNDMNHDDTDEADRIPVAAT